MKLVFVSNYINHHQIPFCREAQSLLGRGNFVFFQTQPMEEERRAMGWQEEIPEYVRPAYGTDAQGMDLKTAALWEISGADVVLFGGCEDESYIRPRLEEGKLTLRYSERVYKEGQWKCITPRGLLRKYHDHTAFAASPVYLLCSGAYVASDFGIFRAYPGKMFRWGYFPEIRRQDSEALFARKAQNPVPVLLWAGRMIDWKHPEVALRTAAHLRETGASFRLRMVGGGDMLEPLKEMTRALGLEEVVSFPGFCTPEQVREEMEAADFYLFTSDRKEGWGAVANEAMNSGCVVLADARIGAVPYLVRNGENGIVYDGRKKGCAELLAREILRLLEQPGECRRMGEAAYRTVKEIWNPHVAAERLIRLSLELQKAWGLEDGMQGKPEQKKRPATLAAGADLSFVSDGGPLTPERPRPERKILREALGHASSCSKPVQI